MYLDRDDADRRGELTLRGRWRYQPSDDLRIDLSVLHVQIDNGYDAFSLNNTRTTQSNEPSVDSQHSTGASLRLAYSGLGAATLTVIGTYAQTYVKYGYDGDWGNPLLWAAVHRTTTRKYKIATGVPRAWRCDSERTLRTASTGWWACTRCGSTESLVDTSAGCIWIRLIPAQIQ